jgi:lipid-A-disaccharide synthase
MSPGPLRIAILAGEESGDRLGAGLIHALRARVPQGVNVIGIGGDELAGAGMDSRFPIDEISLMGINAVVRQLPNLIRRLSETTAWLVEQQPDCIVAIDAPDFTLRVAKRVRARAPDIPIVSWVSPSVWAWRPGRAKAMASFVDHLLAILPFEPDVHERLGGPPCTYVGHPLLDKLDRMTPEPGERPTLAKADRPVLLVLPGSRTFEIKRLMQPFRETVEALAERGLRPRIIMPTVPRRKAMIRELAAQWSCDVDVTVGEEAKWAALRQAHAALAASGTVTLELALAGVPHAAAYKTDTLISTIRRWIRPWTIVLPNLVLGRPAIREYIDDYVRPEPLAAQLEMLLTETPERAAMLKSLAELRDAFQSVGDDPAGLAADIVLDVMAARSNLLMADPRA